MGRKGFHFRGGRGGLWPGLGHCAVALGAGVVLAVLFPSGALVLLLGVAVVGIGVYCCCR